MEANEVLNLFNSLWFEHGILSNLPVSQSVPQIQAIETEHLKLSGPPNLRPTKDDRCLDDLKSAEIQENIEKSMEKKSSPRNRRKKVMKKDMMISRSLSALEFEEVKGFIDMGFVFTEEDKKSQLVSIIPGLVKWGNNNREIVVKEKNEVSRPYLSEAWQVSFMNLRIPSVNNEINMKDHIRVWAHNVASTVI